MKIKNEVLQKRRDMCRICYGEHTFVFEEHIRCSCHAVQELSYGAQTKTMNCVECASLAEISGPEISELKSLNCSFCVALEVLPRIQGLKTLFCVQTSISAVPIIRGLRKLDCSECENLTAIPVIPGLEELDCRFIPNLTAIGASRELQKLDCSGCPRLSSLPGLPRLKYLDCRDCHGLETIPEYKELVDLGCEGCSSLRDVPLRLEKLEIMDCDSCPMLLRIPVAENMKELHCSECRSITELPVMPRLEYVDHSFCANLVILPENVAAVSTGVEGCYWLETDTLENIRRIQKYIRGWLFRQRILLRAEQVAPLWWAPKAKGAHFYKKKMQRSMEVVQPVAIA